MGWKHYQIKDHATHTLSGPGHFKPEFEAYYWQVNLMCHVLKDYTYREMLEDKVSVAMNKFQGRVDWIQDQYSENEALELHKNTKELLQRLLGALELLFKQFYPETKMKELYTSKPGTFDKAVVTLFEALGDVVELDTDTQVVAGKKRFHKPCEVCLPFLPIMKGMKGNKQVDEKDMEKVIAGPVGDRTLRGLFLGSKKDQNLVDAIRFARSVHILSSPAKEKNEPKVLEFKNDLVCNGTICEAQDDCFCVAGEDGCSATSDGKKVRLKRPPTRKTIRKTRKA